MASWTSKTKLKIMVLEVQAITKINMSFVRLMLILVGGDCEGVPLWAYPIDLKWVLSGEGVSIRGY